MKRGLHRPGVVEQQLGYHVSQLRGKETARVMPVEITEKQDVSTEEARLIEMRSPGEGVSIEHQTKPSQ
jgi:hypothetical protein